MAGVYYLQFSIFLIAKKEMPVNSNIHLNPNFYLAMKRTGGGVSKENVQNVLSRAGEIKCSVLEHETKII